MFEKLGINNVVFFPLFTLFIVCLLILNFIGHDTRSQINQETEKLDQSQEIADLESLVATNDELRSKKSVYKISEYAIPLDTQSTIFVDVEKGCEYIIFAGAIYPRLYKGVPVCN